MSSTRRSTSFGEVKLQQYAFTHGRRRLSFLRFRHHPEACAMTKLLLKFETELEVWFAKERWCCLSSAYDSARECECLFLEQVQQL